MTPTPQQIAANIQFAAWLQKNHPQVFKVLLKKATASAMGAIYRGNFDQRRQALEGFGDYGDYFSYFSSAVSDSTGLPALSDISNLDNSNLVDSVTDTPVTTDLDDQLQSEPLEPSGDLDAETAVAPTVAIDSGDAASSITPSGVPTAPASAPTSATSSVGNYLTSPAGAQVLSAAITGAAQIVNANTAANVIESQAARAAAGLAPANVSYVATTNPTTGQSTVTPVLNTSSGAVALSNAGIEAMTPSSFLQEYGLYIMLGIGAFVALT